MDAVTAAGDATTAVTGRAVPVGASSVVDVGKWC